MPRPPFPPTAGPLGISHFERIGTVFERSHVPLHSPRRARRRAQRAVTALDLDLALFRGHPAGRACVLLLKCGAACLKSILWVSEAIQIIAAPLPAVIEYFHEERFQRLRRFIAFVMDALRFNQVRV